MRFVAIVAALALLGTVAFAQSITCDFDKSANFKSCKSYAWVTGTNLPDTFNHERIIAAVNAQIVDLVNARTRSVRTS